MYFLSHLQVRCWNLIEPWTKIFYDIDGTSNNGMLGFEKLTKASDNLSERIITATDHGVNLREITKGIHKMNIAAFFWHLVVTTRFEALHTDLYFLYFTFYFKMDILPRT